MGDTALTGGVHSSSVIDLMRASWEDTFQGSGGDMNRRTFLKQNAALLIGSGFLANWGTRAQIKTYKQPGKPLLTEANLNRFFEETRSRGELSKHAHHARTDVSDFLHANFSLSPQQEATLAKLTPAQRNQLDEVLARAEQPGASVNFKFVANPKQCATHVNVVSGGVTKSVAL